MQALFKNYAWFQRCDDYDQGTVDFLLAERIRKGTKDRGEAEAVVQASQFGAMVIVDDRWGNEQAARHDLETHGTLWLLKRFYELDLISSAACRESFASLRTRGIRLPWDAVNEFLLKIGQPPL
jgi:predicted nucleic acid-binding protein